MYKDSLALNNLQRLICHKTKTTQLFLKIFLIYNFICLNKSVLISVIFVNVCSSLLLCEYF